MITAAMARIAAPNKPPMPLDPATRREAKFAFILAIALSIGVQGSMFLTPLITMHIFDGVLRTHNLSTLTVLTLVLLVGLSLGGLLRYLRALLLTIIAERIGRRLQLRALTASVHVALNGDRLRPVLALSDVAALRRLLGSTVPADLLDLVMIPAGLVFLWFLHPLYFASGFVLILGKGMLAVLSDRATRSTLMASSLAVARSGSELNTWLSQRETILGLGLMPATLRRWAPVWLRALEQKDHAEQRAQVFSGLTELAGYAQQFVILATGAWLLVHNETTTGSMMAAMIMMGLITGPILSLMGRWHDWSGGALAWRRITALVRDAVEPEPRAVDSSAPPGLVFDGVTLRPPGGTRDLVRDLSLTMALGEAWALLGPNGVGKTTLLRTALGVAEPRTGRVLLDGQDTFHADRASLGPRLGYLPQEPQLMTGSVVENIGRFSDHPATEAVAASRRAGVHDTIGRLYRGYDTPAGIGGGLSGGQQRLVALARAMHGSPRLLVLDEPEAGLNAASRTALRDAVQAAKAKGAIVLLVTHDIRPWIGVVDHALRLKPDATWQAGPLTTEDGACAA